MYVMDIFIVLLMDCIMYTDSLCNKDRVHERTVSFQALQTVNFLLSAFFFLRWGELYNLWSACRLQETMTGVILSLV